MKLWGCVAILYVIVSIGMMMLTSNVWCISGVVIGAVILLVCNYHLSKAHKNINL